MNHNARVIANVFIPPVTAASTLLQFYDPQT